MSRNTRLTCEGATPLALAKSSIVACTPSSSIFRQRNARASALTIALSTRGRWAGHVHAFTFFGGVPQSVLYDNDRCLVARILADGTRKRATLFSGFLSHYLIRDRYGRPGKGNDKGAGTRLPSSRWRWRGWLTTWVPPSHASMRSS